MYKNDIGYIVYETFEELLNADIIFMSEDDSFYYINLKTEFYYDNGMWKVDKKTKEVSFLSYTDYIVNIESNTKQINPDMFRRSL